MCLQTVPHIALAKIQSCILIHVVTFDWFAADEGKSTENFQFIRFLRTPSPFVPFPSKQTVYISDWHTNTIFIYNGPRPINTDNSCTWTLRSESTCSYPIPFFFRKKKRSFNQKQTTVLAHIIMGPQVCVKWWRGGRGYELSNQSQDSRSSLSLSLPSPPSPLFSIQKRKIKFEKMSPPLLPQPSTLLHPPQ